VPDRFNYGYGLTPEIVEVAMQWKPDLLVTVDNGISSIQGVAVAKEQGVQVLVTDHHLPGSVLPNADAIVNPNQPGDTFPSKNLAGVGVIFYVMMALRAKLRQQGWFESNKVEEPNLANLLDIVALGTVADVVPLDANNRIIVEQGLRRIRSGQCCEGISALLKMAGRNQGNIVASDLGFAVGPRLNAAGRLEDMSLGIECLLTDNTQTAMTLAGQLHQLNLERREIESDMRDQAMAALESLHFSTDEGEVPTGLCLFDEGWHQGVIGILASRIKEKFHRPVIAFAPAEGSNEIKGSARSIPGIHIRDVLDAVAAMHPGLIIKFVGHAMAAGLSLEKENFQSFARAFDEEVKRVSNEDLLQGVILSDGELSATDFQLELAEQLRNAGPWGQGFPEPVFDGEFQLVNKRILGEKHIKMVLRPPSSDQIVDAIAFNAVEHGWDTDNEIIRVAYRLDVNEFRGQRSLQLMVEYMEPA
jgi:single-stranded-DNA-specific exonuclease